jgi:hypothetical protein
MERIADAERYRQIAVAEGEADAIRSVFTAMHDGNPTAEVLALKYLDALVRVGDGQATKIFRPTEMGGLFGAIGGLAELLRGDDEAVSGNGAQPAAAAGEGDDSGDTSRARSASSSITARPGS